MEQSAEIGHLERCPGEKFRSSLKFVVLSSAKAGTPRKQKHSFVLLQNQSGQARYRGIASPRLQAAQVPLPSSDTEDPGGEGSDYRELQSYTLPLSQLISLGSGRRSTNAHLSEAPGIHTQERQESEQKLCLGVEGGLQQLLSLKSLEQVPPGAEVSFPHLRRSWEISCGLVLPNLT